MEDLISHIVEEWFLTEPLLFSAWCTHSLAENTRMYCPMRTGKMRIEYNPDILCEWSKEAIEERLRFEVIRILLGHPYQRQPYKARKATLGIASDVTLTSTYHSIKTIRLPKGLRYDKGLCFEEYYSIVQAYLDQLAQQCESPTCETEGFVDDGGGGTDNPLRELTKEAADAAELWEENQLAAEQVTEVVRRAQRSRQWGSLGGGLKDEIEATTIVRIDYRTILSGFRASVLSSKRHLTRMIPSRRYGFQYMGSKRDFATRLLVAIDVSGSVDNQQVSLALSIINRFFKYGVENVDVIQFDVGLHGDVLPMKKAQKSIKIEGRGGTDFQAPIDYFLKERYDGLIMITDGYAPRPDIPDHFYGNILWMLYDYNFFHLKSSHELASELQWITEYPKSKYTILPPV